MQCNFTFYRFVSSSPTFLELVIKLFDYFGKPNSLFSKFCVNCLLIFYFVYCNNCVLTDINWACWYTCSLVALRVPEKCFWPAKAGKALKFLRCIHVFDLVLKYVSDINEGNWLQLLFYFIILTGRVTAVIEIKFFSAVFHVLDWSFLLLHFDGNVCNWIPKVIWPRMDWFWGFLLEKSFFRWLNICMDWNLQELLNFHSFWRHQIFSIFSLRGILVCSLKKLVLFSHGIL